MRVPEVLQPLLDQGVIQDVIRPLMSGKEADVFLVEAEGYLCVAKTYKQAINRSFKHRVQYTEGRKVRNSRKQRAMDKRSKYGRAQMEAEWQNQEVDVLFRLADAGVSVPHPYAFVENVLVMDLIEGPNGGPAPRLVDANFTEDEAWELFHIVLQEVVKMLCAGVVHGDLSDFNILLAHDGPVIIDFPQAVDPAANRNARELLIRDVNNLTNFLVRYAPNLKKKRYGEEMWALFEEGSLRPDTRLTGRFQRSTKKADTTSLLAEIEAIAEESARKREALGLAPRRPARTPIVRKPDPPPKQKHRRKGKPPERRAKKRPARGRSPKKPMTPKSFAESDDLDAFLFES